MYILLIGRSITAKASSVIKMYFDDFSKVVGDLRLHFIIKDRQRQSSFQKYKEGQNEESKRKEKEIPHCNQ